MPLFTKLLFLGLSLPLASFGGNWGSSGGEFLRDQQNPWFLKNTAEVRYCLEMDPSGFSASPKKIELITRQAIAYWKKELKDRGELLGLGTQEFVQALGFPAQKCDGNEDLKIQFGHGTLTPAQLKLFTDNNEDPQDYVGIAIRTTYDKVNMKGKGFIFIGSDKGTHPYNRGESVAKNLWSHDGLLFGILQHELGHVFGVTHTDHGFMAADFSEAMIRNFEHFRTIDPKSFFTPPSTSVKCLLGSSRSELIPCLMIESKDHWKSFTLVSHFPELRKLTGNSTRSQRLPPRQSFPVKIFLPKEQKVFNVRPGTNTLKGPAREEFKVSADVINDEGEKSSLLLELRPESFEIYLSSPEGINRLL